MENDQTYNLAMNYDYQDSHNNVPCCHEPGCDASSIRCEIPGEEYTYQYYCPKHAADNGFCLCCGTFIAGWIDYGHLCDNCQHEVESSMGDEF